MRATAEAAVGTRDHVFPADELTEAFDPLRHQLGVLDYVGRVRPRCAVSWVLRPPPRTTGLIGSDRRRARNQIFVELTECDHMLGDGRLSDTRTRKTEHVPRPGMLQPGPAAWTDLEPGARASAQARETIGSLADLLNAGRVLAALARRLGTPPDDGPHPVEEGARAVAAGPAGKPGAFGPRVGRPPRRGAGRRRLALARLIAQAAVPEEPDVDE
jgi:hypothetical protein